MLTLAVIGALAVLGVIGWRIWAARAGRRRAVDALVAECPGFDDRLEGRDAVILFSGTDEMLGIASARATRMLPYSVIRKWRTEPIYNAADRRVGWNFIIETGEVAEPIWTVRIRSGPGTALPNFWMAKFNAHLNG